MSFLTFLCGLLVRKTNRSCDLTEVAAFFGPPVLAAADKTFTIAALWRMDDPWAEISKMIFYQGGVDSNAYQTYACLYYGIYLDYGYSGGNNDLLFSDAYVENQWQLSILRVDNYNLTSNIRLEGNGKKFVGSTTDPSAMSLGAYGSSVGCSRDPGGYLVGNIAEIFVFDSAISDEDVAAVGSFVEWKWGLDYGYPSWSSVSSSFPTRSPTPVPTTPFIALVTKSPTSPGSGARFRYAYRHLGCHSFLGHEFFDTQ